jgi:hypothetical protein
MKEIITKLKEFSGNLVKSHEETVQ